MGREDDSSTSSTSSSGEDGYAQSRSKRHHTPTKRRMEKKVPSSRFASPPRSSVSRGFLAPPLSVGNGSRFRTSRKQADSSDDDDSPLVQRNKLRNMPTAPSMMDSNPSTPEGQKGKANMKGFSLQTPVYSPKTPTTPVSESIGKKKVPAWKLRGNGGISFQATPSPTSMKKPPVPITPDSLGFTSFLDKDASTTRSSISRKSRKSYNADELIADIKIEAKIPNIDAKMRQRRLSQENQEENVPEAVRRYRAREAARLAALNEKEREAEKIIKHAVLGWYIRTIWYPRKLAEHQALLRRKTKAKARQKVVHRSAIKIQAVFRGFLPRKQFKREIFRVRRKSAHEKKLKGMEQKIATIQAMTEIELQRMKKEHLTKKKALKQRIKTAVKNDEQNLLQVKESSHDRILGLQADNRQLREQKAIVKKDIKLLTKQANMLKDEYEETQRRIGSIKEFAEKKEASIQKREIQSQKCRLRYLPKKRDELAQRDIHCIKEHRVKNLYRENLYRICKAIQDRCHEDDVRNLVISNILECESEVKKRPAIRMPDELKKYFD